MSNRAATLIRYMNFWCNWQSTRDELDRRSFWLAASIIANNYYD